MVILISVKQQVSSSGEEEENLQELLDEAERRKNMQIKRLGGRVSMIVCIPIILLFGWAGIFLIQYNMENPPEATPAPKIAVTAPGAAKIPLTDEQVDMAQYDMFRDEKDRVIKTNILGLEKSSDKMIDKDDIHFAMELLNFMQPPNHSKTENH